MRHSVKIFAHFRLDARKIEDLWWKRGLRFSKHSHQQNDRSNGHLADTKPGTASSGLI
jgi:hypothetical protein